MTAYDFAAEKHSGQTDRGGKPYIDHCRFVASRAVELAHRAGVRAEHLGRIYEAGLLHDVVEDTDATLAEIYKRFGFGVADIVRAMTKVSGEARADYIERVRSHDFAPFVKMADLTHNMDLTRIKSPSAKDFERVVRYQREFRLLNGDAPHTGPSEGFTQQGARP